VTSWDRKSVEIRRSGCRGANKAQEGPAERSSILPPPGPNPMLRTNLSQRQPPAAGIRAAPGLQCRRWHQPRLSRLWLGVGAGWLYVVHGRTSMAANSRRCRTPPQARNRKNRRNPDSTRDCPSIPVPPPRTEPAEPAEPFTNICCRKEGLQIMVGSAGLAVPPRVRTHPSAGLPNTP
jgi:hypothetical protein